MDFIWNENSPITIYQCGICPPTTIFILNNFSLFFGVLYEQFI
jgi:hypothetical protein